MKLCSYLLSACFCALFPVFSVAQTADDALTRELEAILQSSGFPGFALAVTRDDATLYSRGFGYADRIAKAPFTTQTTQPLGSVSKTVVGVAVMKAVELGLCSLDVDINEYLPFKVQNPYRPNDRITLRHLATHTSALIDQEDTYRGTYALSLRPTAALGQFLQDYYTPAGKLYSKQNFADSEVGKRYAYSNVASALAAFIVEQRAKMPFDQFTATHIFAPLEMSSTRWFASESVNKNDATLYEINKQTDTLIQKLLNADGSLKPYSAITYPDGGLRSSVLDMTRDIKAMSQGFAGRASVLRADSFAAMFKPQFDASDMPAGVAGKEPNSGIFWAYARNGSIRHTGSDPGVFAFISFHPKSRIGRVFMMNTQLDGDDNVRAVKSFQGIVEALDRFEATIK